MTLEIDTWEVDLSSDDVDRSRVVKKVSFVVEFGDGKIQSGEVVYPRRATFGYATVAEIIEHFQCFARDDDYRYEFVIMRGREDGDEQAASPGKD